MHLEKFWTLPTTTLKLNVRQFVWVYYNYFAASFARMAPSWSWYLNNILEAQVHGIGVCYALGHLDLDILAWAPVITPLGTSGYAGKISPVALQAALSTSVCIRDIRQETCKHKAKLAIFEAINPKISAHKRP